MLESQLLSHIYARSRGLESADSGVLIGPGDDCAVVQSAATAGPLLLTVDQLVQGRHFDAAAPIELIARKAIARSVSDIAAMAGRPRWALATGLLPNPFDAADALFDAMARWARHWGCPLVGGDIATWARGDEGAGLALTVTVVGEPHPRRGPILRSTARPGDDVWVTGALGNSLASGRHFTFEPRVRQAAALADAIGDRLHAMIDLSDGLGRDAGRIAAASSVRIELDAACLPRHPDVTSWRSAAADGEDYELLFTTAPGAPVPASISGIPFTRLGRVLAGAGCVILGAGPAPIDAAQLGWDHGEARP